MNVRPLSDSALLNEYLSGNKDAISQLIELHRKKVFDYVMMMASKALRASSPYLNCLAISIPPIISQR